ncbi:MAG: tRNA (N6-threonylcarbamoyladenosine(37)-N6)-methyltransferase TrmO [Colwellia sp.]|nr:tRNA (N6-threonylcarbamoyladenosine(37)-N6)-methyltransferase TrmO [Colwellia sp.]
MKYSELENSALDIKLDVIGSVVSPYQEKFAIPRQPGIVSAAKGQILLQGNANNIELVRGLEQFSHLWLIFIFHGSQSQGWKPLVRPPRLGGNKKLGVLATRSTFRPNPIGMSVVKLDDIRQEKLTDGRRQVIIDISGLDLLNGTPIVDIKPYVPYCDSIDDARAGFAQTQPSANLEISFNAYVEVELARQQPKYPELRELIEQVLKQDPRPAYKQNTFDEKIYGMSLYQFNIQWQMTSLTKIMVSNISMNTNTSPENGLETNQ